MSQMRDPTARRGRLGHISRSQAELVWGAGPRKPLRERAGTFLYQHYTCTVTPRRRLRQ
jgi:hypothetical protein